MNNHYISTRGDGSASSFTDVLMQGLAPDGGLYVPQEWPVLDRDALRDLPYADLVYEVIRPFVGGEIPDAYLKRLVSETYAAEIFENDDVAPLVDLGGGLYVMELFHGPTLAFKDYALQLLGRLFDYVLEKRGQRITIVGATSGDTGSAAIEACCHCRNIDIFILHPKGRTSEVQRRQMTTVLSPNVFNIALEGTFDDCQNLVKAMFNDRSFRAEMNLSAVNSINWARIMAQIAYYVHAARRVVLGGGNSLSFAVPTGNFGNVYAAWCARQMGLPVSRLIIGSNRNDILTRFFESGEMKMEAVEPSLSPSMDIQLSSNFERFLFDLLGRDPSALRSAMESFSHHGIFTVPENTLEKARTDFAAYSCDDAQTLSIMKSFYEKFGYRVDPHTAVGLNAALRAREDGVAPGSIVALACAHPAKFPAAVEKATGRHPSLPLHLADLYEREERFTILPRNLNAVQGFIKEQLGS